MVPISYKKPIIKVLPILKKDVSISLKFQKRNVNRIKKEKHKKIKIKVFNNESLSGKSLNLI
jgi:hypothetical protein